MKEKQKNIILYSITILFSITFGLIIANFVYAKTYYAFFWSSYITLSIIIIGLLKKNSNIILSQLIILWIPNLFWTFDFFYMTFSGNSLFGIVNFFPKEIFLLKLASLEHIYVIFLSLLALSILKVKKNYKILLASLVEITLIFFLTLFFAPKRSINCLDLSCITVPLNFLPSYLIWFILTFSFITVSYFIITFLPFVRKKN